MEGERGQGGGAGCLQNDSCCRGERRHTPSLPPLLLPLGEVGMVGVFRERGGGGKEG